MDDMSNCFIKEIESKGIAVMHDARKRHALARKSCTPV